MLFFSVWDRLKNLSEAINSGNAYKVAECCHKDDLALIIRDLPDDDFDKKAFAFLIRVIVTDFCVPMRVILSQIVAFGKPAKLRIVLDKKLMEDAMPTKGDLVEARKMAVCALDEDMGQICRSIIDEGTYTQSSKVYFLKTDFQICSHGLVR